MGHCIALRGRMKEVGDDGDDDNDVYVGNDHIGRSMLKNGSDMGVNTIRCVQVLFQIILSVWLCQVLHKCVFSANNFFRLFHIFLFKNYIYFEFNRTNPPKEGSKGMPIERARKSASYPPQGLDKL